MEIDIADTPQELGKRAAESAAACIIDAINEKGAANLIVTTGTSQFDTLKYLTKTPGIDWSKVTGFHLTEFIGIADSHPASSSRYIREYFVSRTGLRAFHYLQGQRDPEEEATRVGNILRKCTVDVALIGIGVNGHLGFNAPPGDFETKKPVHIVKLDQACRLQQMSDGWFHTFHSVPQYAISMSIQEILRAECLICSVPHAHKARAVRKTIKGVIYPKYPSSILSDHKNVKLFLDHASASLLARHKKMSA